MFDENTTTEQLPQTFVSYTASDYKTLLGKPVLREGWMKFTVGNAKQSKSRKGDLMVVLTCNPIDDKDIPRSPSGTVWLIMPFGMAVPEGGDNAMQSIATKFQRTITSSREYLKAVMGSDKLLRFPKFEKTLRSFVDEDGQPISEKVAIDLKAKAIEQVVNLLQTRWADISSYKGETFYANVKHGQDGFVNLRYFRNTEPEELITNNFATVLEQE